jgi:hypothetical protein
MPTGMLNLRDKPVGVPGRWHPRGPFTLRTAGSDYILELNEQSEHNLRS